MIYVPERNKVKAREIESHKLSVLVAPVGYGKTTVVKSLGLPNLVVQNLTDVNATYEDNWGILVKVAEKYPPLAEVLSNIPVPHDKSELRAAFTAIRLQRDKITEPCYVFIDNAHLAFHAGGFSTMLDAIVLLPPEIHLVIATRKDFLTLLDRVKLGPDLFEMGVDDFKLTEEEIVEYGASMGAELGAREAHFLYERTEGWIGCLYGILVRYKQLGVWPDINAFVTGAVSQVVPDEFVDKQMAVLSIADTFNVEFARYMWNKLAQVEMDANAESVNAGGEAVRKLGMMETAEILRDYETNIGFIYRVPGEMDSRWRFHWAFRYCLADRFDCMPRGTRNAMRDALSAWEDAGGETPNSSGVPRIAAQMQDGAHARSNDKGTTSGKPNNAPVRKRPKRDAGKSQGTDAYSDANPGETSEGELYAKAFPELSERERELISFVQRRLSNAEIAERMYLSPGSVKTYFSNIYVKLGIQGGERGKRSALEEFVSERIS